MGFLWRRQVGLMECIVTVTFAVAHHVGCSQGGHSFNSSAVVLNVSAMPPLDPSVSVATDSDVSTASQAVNISISFALTSETSTNDIVRDHALPSGYSFRLQASSLTATHAAGDEVPVWTSSGPDATKFETASGYLSPVYDTDSAGRPVVLFHEIGNNRSALTSTLAVASSSSIFVVMRDDGTENMYSSVVHFDSDRGLAIDPLNCATGYPKQPEPCGPHAPRTIAIDFAGSSNYGKRNISGETFVATVVYNGTEATALVDGCGERGVISVPDAAESSTVTIGLRMDGYDRQFKGAVLDIVVYPSALDNSTQHAIIEGLQSTYNISPRDCGKVQPPTPAPPAPAPAPIPPLQLNCTALRQELNCNGGTWPRKCGWVF
mgnify:CR=1 FL=1